MSYNQTSDFAPVARVIGHLRPAEADFSPATPGGRDGLFICQGADMSEWQVDQWAGRIAIHSDALPQDVALELVGIPAESEEANRIVQAICQALNESPPCMLLAGSAKMNLVA